MIRVNIREAETQLSRYIDLSEQGEVVVICRDDQPVAELRAVEASPIRPARVAGSMEGRIHFDPDAFAPMTAEVLAEFEDGPIFPTGKA